MAQRRMYLGIESVSLTGPQRQTLIDAIKTLGANTHASPARRNHWRVRLDSDAIIFEAEFNDTLLSVAQFKARLATIFGVAVATITSATTTPTAGTVITFSHLAAAKLRVVLFGGAAATYEESHAAALAYLAANSAAWGEA